MAVNNEQNPCHIVRYNQGPWWVLFQLFINIEKIFFSFKTICKEINLKVIESYLTSCTSDNSVANKLVVTPPFRSFAYSEVKNHAFKFSSDIKIQILFFHFNQQAAFSLVSLEFLSEMLSCKMWPIMSD